MTRTLAIEDAKSLTPGADHYRAFVGDPARYDYISASQFALLFLLGLREHHHLLDVGCGSLRLGRLAIPYLLPDRYCALEPEFWLVDEGLDRELGRDALALKRPRFDANTEFRADMFGTKFDFMVAQSIFSHTGTTMAARGLKALAPSLAPTGLMLSSWWIGAGLGAENPEGREWVYPECVQFRDTQIVAMAGQAGLFARRVPWAHPALTWYAMAHDEDLLPPVDGLATLIGVPLPRPD